MTRVCCGDNDVRLLHPRFLRVLCFSCFSTSSSSSSSSSSSLSSSSSSSSSLSLSWWASKEEETYRRAIEQEKVVYKDSFETLRILKPEIEHIRKILEKGRASMQSQFDQWFNSLHSRSYHTHSPIHPPGVFSDRMGCSAGMALFSPRTRTVARTLDRLPGPPTEENPRHCEGLIVKRSQQVQVDLIPLRALALYCSWRCYHIAHTRPVSHIASLT